MNTAPTPKAAIGRPDEAGQAAWRLRAERYWRAPVDGAALGVFRWVFGLLLAAEAGRYLVHGWYRDLSRGGLFHFKYVGFSWVEAATGAQMEALFWALGGLGVLLALGRWARLWAALLGLGWGYVFLVDAAFYLNHLYLIVLVLAVLAGIDAGAALAPGQAERRVPRWQAAALPAQMGLVYLFAAFAKLTPDWLAGRPMDLWLAERATTSGLAEALVQPWSARLASWGGLAFDALIVPALLWRRTRPWALLAAALFHGANAYLFDIGIFPFVALALTSLFCDPGWPRAWLRRGADGGAPRDAGRGLLLAAAFFAAQIVIPLRFLAYEAPWEVNWTESGHRFSWRMKLRDKRSRVTFLVSEPLTGRSWEVDAASELLPRQMRELGARPDLIAQFARHLREEAPTRWGASGVEVRARVLCSLNGAEPRLLVDPEVDLGRERPGLRQPAWVRDWRAPP